MLDMAKKDCVVNASEIGDFYYCPVSWYLKRQGYKPKSAELKKGKVEHEKLGETLEFTKRAKNRSKKIWYVGCLLMILGFLIFFWEEFLWGIFPF